MSAASAMPSVHELACASCRAARMHPGTELGAPCAPLWNATGLRGAHRSDRGCCREEVRGGLLIFDYGKPYAKGSNIGSQLQTPISSVYRCLVCELWAHCELLGGARRPCRLTGRLLLKPHSAPRQARQLACSPVCGRCRAPQRSRSDEHGVLTPPAGEQGGHPCTTPCIR